MERCLTYIIIRETRQNCHEVTLLIHQDSNCQKYKNNQCQKEYEENGSFVIGENLKWYSHCGQQYNSSSKAKNRITTRVSYSTSGYTSKRVESRVSRAVVHTCSKWHCLQELKCGSNSSVNQQMDRQNVVYTYNEILCDLKKEGNCNTYYNTNELRGLYAKGNNLVTKANTLWVVES